LFPFFLCFFFLCVQPSSSDDGRKQNRRSGTVDLPGAFASWLKTQHERLDREIQVHESTRFRKDDRVHYTRFSFRLGDEEITLSAGDTISSENSCIDTERDTLRVGQHQPRATVG